MESSRIKIDSINLSNVLSQQEFASIPVKKFTKGNIAYDNKSLTLYVFKSGKAKAIIYENDEEFILYYLEKDNIIIPEESCVIEFIEESEVYLIDAQSFYSFFKNEKFSIAIISSLKQRAVMERRIIKNLVFKTCKNRIASFLLEIATAQNEQLLDDIYIHLDLSVKELATFIGSKRQTVSTVFHELMKDNTIEKIKKNKYIIHNIKKLEEYTHSS
ncbi:Crp/Fnr family transcriptional regulator [Sulfurospirillum arcachonense]|uniref:Crp/Fnr family transcriptional regulator n=1 Tax=Sulfurospirillum arcachonense TaxID=57666 RepID=UPI00046899CC|nr:Crp/Fnr family transcriptional regulator [Sulfurospirillum arcachonense]